MVALSSLNPFTLPETKEINPVSTKFRYSQNLSRQLATLFGLTRLLNSPRRLEQQLSLILKETNQILDAETTVLYLLNEKQRELWQYRLNSGEVRQLQQPLGQGIAEYVLRTGKVITLADAYQDPQIRREIARLDSTPVQSFLIVPVAGKCGKLIGCIQVVNKRSGAFDSKDTQYLMIIADLLALAIRNTLAAAQAEEGRRLETEMRQAAEIQRRFLPAQAPKVPQYEIFTFYQASKYLGGDYYDFFPFANSFSWVVADVSGKGAPAALLGANLHACLHAFAERADSGKEIVQKVNRQFHACTASDKYATFFWGNIDYQQHRFKYINAGHTPPLLVKREGAVQRLKPGGLPIGIVEAFEFEETETSIEPGDSLLIFSDGITDALSPENERFGKRCLHKMARQYGHLPPAELGKAILDQLGRFVGASDYPDDLTLLILRRNAA